MKLTLFFPYIERLLDNFYVIINRLILYNEYYDGKNKNIIHRNLNTIHYFILLLQEIGLIIYYKKNIDEFFKLIDSINIDDYNLVDIDNGLYYYHLINYKLYVELFEHLKKILKSIKLFCDEVKNIKGEINSKIREIQRNQNIVKSSSSLDFYRKTLETFIIHEPRSSNKRDIINEIITYISKLKKRNNKKLLEVKKVLNDNNIYIFDNDMIDDIKKSLNKENKHNLNKINEIILSIYMKLSSSKKTEDIIDEIIMKLIKINYLNLFEEIKKILSSNYNIKSNSINEENIIIEVVKIIISETSINNKILEIRKIINYNYENTEYLNEDFLIKRLIEIKEINNNITGYIKNELNIKNIFILDKYLKGKLLIDEIKIKLREEENITLKKINKIISKFNIEDNKNKDLSKLEKYYKFINSWDNINILDIDNIVYLINETNEIKREIESSDLLNIEIKEKILSKIIYYSYDIFDNINVKISYYFTPINNYKTEIIQFDILYIKDIMKIIGLYHKLVSNNLTDVKMNENVNEILNIDNHYLYNVLNKNFKLINLHYKFDYDFIKITNINNLKTYLEKIFLYKNYIFVIRNLYIFLLSIKNNFNLLYTTIQKIKKKIDLYDKLDKSLKEILFKKLNDVNDNNFKNYEDIKTYLNKFMFN